MDRAAAPGGAPSLRQGVAERGRGELDPVGLGREDPHAPRLLPQLPRAAFGTRLYKAHGFLVAFGFELQGALDVAVGPQQIKAIPRQDANFPSTARGCPPETTANRNAVQAVVAADGRIPDIPFGLWAGGPARATSQTARRGWTRRAEGGEWSGAEPEARAF